MDESPRVTAQGSFLWASTERLVLTITTLAGGATLVDYRVLGYRPQGAAPVGFWSNGASVVVHSQQNPLMGATRLYPCSVGWCRPGVLAPLPRMGCRACLGQIAACTS